jgi:lambda family phage portal protein
MPRKSTIKRTTTKARQANPTRQAPSISITPIDLEASLYAGATSSTNRKAQWQSKVSGDEESYLSPQERLNLIMDSNIKYRNSSLIKALVDRMTDYVIGKGITPSTRSKDSRFNQAAEDYFIAWSDSCDYRGRDNLRTMLRQIISARLLSGDIGFYKIDGQLMPVESDRIVSPKKTHKDYPKYPARVTHGIEYDSYGRTLAYWVANRSKGKVDLEDVSRIDAKDFILVANYIRPDQKRGIPELASILPEISDLNELSENVIKKSKREATAAYLIKTNAETMPSNFPVLPNDQTENNPASTQKEYKASGDLEDYYLRADSNEDIKLISGNYPSSTYDTFLRTNIQKISAALGIPDSILLLDYSKLRQSASKTCLQAWYTTIDQWQTWLTDTFLRPVYLWKIKDAIRQGIIDKPTDKDPLAWSYVSWSYPKKDGPDPYKDICATEKELALGLGSLTENAEIKGKEIEDIFEDRKDEMVLAYTKAQEANKVIGKDVFTWKDFCNVNNVIPDSTMINGIDDNLDQTTP